MPPRLALMATVGAVLVLGACSSGSKTVTKDAAPPPPMAPIVMLPAAAAAAFPTGDTTITVAPDEATRDANGNRYRDVNGYRFVCTGAEVCTWTVTKDADGDLTVEVMGDVARRIAAAPPPPAPFMPSVSDAAKTALNEALTAGEPKKITVAADEADRDADGNRYLDAYGVRFVCRGSGTCTWTVTEDADGDLTVEVMGDVARQLAAAPPPPAPFMPSVSDAAKTALNEALTAGEPKKITVAADEADRDADGNRYLDAYGVRFVCRGSGTCTWTVTEDADGDLTVEVMGDVARQLAAAPPPPAPIASLPAAAKAAFPLSQYVVTVQGVSGAPTTNARQDSRGNWFRDFNGYRFTCRGAAACTWTITKDADGELEVASTGNVEPGAIYSVRSLGNSGIERFFDARSGAWDGFVLAPGKTRDVNLVRVACAAGGEPCDVVIDRGVSGTNRLLVSRGGALSFSRAQEFYDGLAYSGDNGRRSDDPVELSLDLGTAAAATGVAPWQRSANAAGVGDYRAFTMAHVRAASAGDGQAPASSGWGAAGGLGHQVRVQATQVFPSGRSGMFAGFKDGTSASDRGNTYGARQAGVPRLAIDLAATHNVANRPIDTVAGMLTWTVELAEKTEGRVEYADAITRSPTDMWTKGFVAKTPLGEDTADDASDDGILHYQLFTDYDVDKKVDPQADFGDFTGSTTGESITGTVLIVGAGGVVPNGPPAPPQVIGSTAVAGTYNGVPGTFTCAGTGVTATTGCSVSGASGGQTLTTLAANIALNFTPTTGAQVVEDTDWLAIGSWALKMGDGATGATVYGAFVEHGTPHTHAGAHTQAVGLATYNGQARGHYAEFDNGTRGSGVFAATAKFNADFRGATQDGNIYGTLRSFSTTAHGQETAVDRSAWAIDFASAADPHEFSFSGGGEDHLQGFTPDLTGKWGAGSDNTLVGDARLKFFRSKIATTVQPTQPTAIAGTFAATSGPNDDNYDLSLIGAVGAKR